MKKLFLSAFLLSTIVISVNAQTVNLGAKLGGNLTKIEAQSFDNGFNLGYQVGAFAEIDFGKKFGIQPEVLFSQTETRTTTFNGLLSPNKDAKLNYLSIPVLLRINVTKMLTLHVGPEYSILVNNDKSFVQNGQEAFKSGNFSMIGGLQLNIKALRVYGRYNIGLSNINQLDNKEEWKSQQLQIGVGLKLF